MKKLISLGLVGVMALSMVPMAYATTDYKNGTEVVYVADEDIDGDGVSDAEYYEVTVPALMAPGDTAAVSAKGTWASDRKLVVNADTSVTLTNSINAADQKVLDVTFTDGLVVAGSNTVEVTGEKDITIADIEDALFGTWSGTFNYTAGIVDAE